ncbi:pyridoxal phosphate-dependent aminotransferase [bacterium]|nr:pyridoxal phosphate-dependent aminotransferase [bacterium]
MPRPADLRDHGFKATIFNRIREEIDARSGSGEAPIALHVGDTYSDLPPELNQPLDAEPWNDRMSRYGETQGEPELRRRLFNKLTSINKLPIDSERDIQITFGATGGLFLAMTRLLEPGDEVLTLSPHWTIFKVVASTAKVRAVEVPFFHHFAPQAQDIRLDGHPTPSAGADVEQILTPFLTDNTRAIYFNNPNNPSGVFLPLPILEQIAAFARKHDLWVLSDEAYEEYVWAQQPYVSIASLPGMHERTVSVFSASKSYAAAGLRLGWIAAAPGPLAAMHPAHVGVGYEPNRPSQVQGIRALAHHYVITERLRTAYLECRSAAMENLKRPYMAADGSFYLFVDMRETWDGLNDAQRLDRMLNAGVVVSPGGPFGAAYDGWARFCYTAEPPEVIAEAARRLTNV